ncbi:MAG: aspartyl protease family protein [Candidatus Micrarchaeota archaeon]|nr:aspartyl protease family protein [Candidatus Micrarchaeota archaeon]
MGHTYVDAIFSNPNDSSKRAIVSGLVDTGATFSMIPKEVANKLGIKPEGKTAVRTAKGVMMLEYAVVKTKIDGEESVFKTLINPVINKSLIGVIVLEALGFKVNPITKKLEKHEIEQYQAIVC